MPRIIVKQKSSHPPSWVTAVGVIGLLVIIGLLVWGFIALFHAHKKRRCLQQRRVQQQQVQAMLTANPTLTKNCANLCGGNADISGLFSSCSTSTSAEAATKKDLLAKCTAACVASTTETSTTCNKYFDRAWPDPSSISGISSVDSELMNAYRTIFQQNTCKSCIVTPKWKMNPSSSADSFENTGAGNLKTQTGLWQVNFIEPMSFIADYIHAREPHRVDHKKKPASGGGNSPSTEPTYAPVKANNTTLDHIFQIFGSMIGAGGAIMNTWTTTADVVRSLHSKALQDGTIESGADLEDYMIEAAVRRANNNILYISGMIKADKKADKKLMEVWENFLESVENEAAEIDAEAGLAVVRGPSHPTPLLSASGLISGDMDVCHGPNVPTIDGNLSNSSFVLQPSQIFNLDFNINNLSTHITLLEPSSDADAGTLWTVTSPLQQQPAYSERGAMRVCFIPVPANTEGFHGDASVCISTLPMTWTKYYIYSPFLQRYIVRDNSTNKVELSKCVHDGSSWLTPADIAAEGKTTAWVFQFNFHMNEVCVPTTNPPSTASKCVVGTTTTSGMRKYVSKFVPINIDAGAQLVAESTAVSAETKSGHSTAATFPVPMSTCKVIKQSSSSSKSALQHCMDTNTTTLLRLYSISRSSSVHIAGSTDVIQTDAMLDGSTINIEARPFADMDTWAFNASGQNIVRDSLKVAPQPVMIHVSTCEPFRISTPFNNVLKINSMESIAHTPQPTPYTLPSAETGRYTAQVRSDTTSYGSNITITLANGKNVYEFDEATIQSMLSEPFTLKITYDGDDYFLYSPFDSNTGDDITPEFNIERPVTWPLYTTSGIVSTNTKWIASNFFPIPNMPGAIGFMFSVAQCGSFTFLNDEGQLMVAPSSSSSVWKKAGRPIPKPVVWIFRSSTTPLCTRTTPTYKWPPVNSQNQADMQKWMNSYLTTNPDYKLPRLVCNTKQSIPAQSNRCVGTSLFGDQTDSITSKNVCSVTYVTDGSDGDSSTEKLCNMSFVDKLETPFCVNSDETAPMCADVIGSIELLPNQPSWIQFVGPSPNLTDEYLYQWMARQAKTLESQGKALQQNPISVSIGKNAPNAYTSCWRPKSDHVSNMQDPADQMCITCFPDNPDIFGANTPCMLYSATVEEGNDQGFQTTSQFKDEGNGLLCGQSCIKSANS